MSKLHPNKSLITLNDTNITETSDEGIVEFMYTEGATSISEIQAISANDIYSYRTSGSLGGLALSDGSPENTESGTFEYLNISTHSPVEPTFLTLVDQKPPCA